MVLFIASCCLPFSRLGEIAQLLGHLSQGHYDQSGCVSAGTAGLAAHALAAVPDGLAFQQLQDYVIIPGLNLVYNPPWIIVVIFRCRAYTCTYAAVHTGIQSLLEADVLHEH